MIEVKKLNNWNPPDGWIEFQTIDAHTEGEPLRIILSGYPKLKGKTLLEKRTNAQNYHDELRKAIIWEPRGHADMYGAIIVEPDNTGADFGVIFIHNEGYSTGCGHAIIALTKVFVETGLIPFNEPETEVKMDVPSGFIKSYAKVNNGQVTEVRFENVPSFVQSLDTEVDVPGFGTINYDLAFGGAFYAFVDVAQLGLDCTPEYQNQLIETGMKIKHAIMDSVETVHPLEPDMNFLYGTIFTGESKDPNHHSRNVCIFANGEVDRSPTGTGVSAKVAILHAKDEIKVGESIIIESIIGSTFSVKVVATTIFGNYDAVIPEVSGNAYITGKNTFWINPEDPSLGADSVKRGTYSVLIGLALILVFIPFYYKLSGIIADFALIWNILLVLAVLASLGATLTLPGIAALILTVGMSVDANVIIFERIREESRKGKTPRTAIDSGYARALTTIIDANVTTLVAALVLYQFGTGPIRGFATVLFWGIMISMFTAIFVTRTIFNSFTERKGLEKLSI